MHQPIRDNLEEYLKGSARQIPQEFHRHLESCEECASELRLYQATGPAMLRLLRPDRDLDPRAGFYARVMERIEQEGRSSIWSVLLQPNFGRRLAVASAVLVMLLGTYFVTSERSEPVWRPPTWYLLARRRVNGGRLMRIACSSKAQRDAVLVNLAAYHE